MPAFSSTSMPTVRGSGAGRPEGSSAGRNAAAGGRTVPPTFADGAASVKSAAISAGAGWNSSSEPASPPRARRRSASRSAK